MAEKAGKLASIKVAGAAVSMTNEAASTTDRYTYQITNAAKRLIDKDTAVVVKVNGVTGSTGFTINHLLGKVVFTAQKSAEDVITISGKYLPLSLAASAYDFTYGKEVDAYDVSRFLDTAKRRISGHKFAYGTLSKWDITDTFFVDALTDGTAKYLVLNSGEGDPQVCFAYFDKSEIKAAINSPQSETVSFISADEQIS